MDRNLNKSAETRLERSCGPQRTDWISSRGPVDGIELLAAGFSGHAFDKHRHDTYAVGVTEFGIQSFDYRGATRSSRAGEVIVLHPDEAHDGRAGDTAGFAYRMVYLDPACVAEALRTVAPRASALPFVRQAVSRNPALARTVRAAFHCDLEPLAVDGLVVDFAEGLAAGDASLKTSPRRTAVGHAAVGRAAIDRAAVERARQFLAAETSRVVRSGELEAVSGLTRFDLARQFRALLGTSPYRYSLMRRLERGRRRIGRGRPLAEAAFDAGFADQAHFSRHFKAAYGLTPGRFARLVEKI